MPATLRRRCRRQEGSQGLKVEPSFTAEGNIFDNKDAKTKLSKSQESRFAPHSLCICYLFLLFLDLRKMIQEHNSLTNVWLPSTAQ
jgi:hypothetical protein